MTTVADVAQRGRWAALMYHELEAAGRPLAVQGPGYAVYCVARDAFRVQMDALLAAGLHGTSLSGAHARCDARTMAITFDDGCETDVLEAAPVLHDRGFGATFFVIGGFLGRPGYLRPSQVRELAGAGFEIGSHSLSHRMLTRLEPDELEEELSGSRARIEDAAGEAVKHLSCPHGRWSPAVAAAARRAGFETVSTSDVGLNGPRTPHERLRRIAVRRGTTAEEVVRYARGSGIWRRAALSAAIAAGRRLTGESAYAALRERLISLRR